MGYWTKKVTIKRYKLIEFMLKYSLYMLFLYCGVLMMGIIANITLLAINHPDKLGVMPFYFFGICAILWWCLSIFFKTPFFNMEWGD